MKINFKFVRQTFLKFHNNLRLCEEKMTELFEEDEKVVTADDEVSDVDTEAEGEAEDWVGNLKVDQVSDARRRLEDLLDERKLREDLDDYFELDDL